jgi:hypothetical protein
MIMVRTMDNEVSTPGAPRGSAKCPMCSAEPFAGDAYGRA